MLKRFLIVIILIALLHIYIGFQLLSNIPIYNIVQIICICLLFLSWIMIPIGMSAKFIIKNQQLSDIITWIGMIFLGIFSSTLILTFIRQITLDIYQLFINPQLSLITISSIAVISIAIIITIIGFINARRVAQVTSIDIPINGLPTALIGFTIVQISDIHVGPTIKYRYLDAIIDKVNDLNADMIAITGDLVDGSVKNLSKHTEPLAKLKSKYGNFFVLGNHEYYSGADSWITEIKRLGITVLLNEHVVITHNNINLVITGITDFSAEKFDIKHKSDPEKAILGAPKDTIKILLAHQPRSAQLASKYGFSLQLSGHTHGGQFWPWNLFVRLQQPFIAGLGMVGGMWVYTNRGTGYWGPPKRLGVPSEITLIRLIKQN